MSDLSPIQDSVSPVVGRISGPASHRRVDAGGAAPRGADRVELSELAYYMAKLAEMPEVRSDLVSQVRSQIEAGTYLTDEKIDGAIDALAEEMN